MQTFLDGRVVLHAGDCLDVVRGLGDCSVDSVCTDPPYALVSISKRFGKEGAALAGAEHAGGAYARASAGFMGKQWDTGETAFAVEFWAEILRVLKPGGHVAAFGGTRSYHRLACAIEDAGFEIRDQLAWCYGTGFPKSHDVSKGIDKAAGAERTKIRIDASRLGNPPNLVGGAVKGDDRPRRLAAIDLGYHEVASDEPATDAARQWEGWGTALKPAWEPICLARKPLSEKTVAANVLRWGTGAINVGACRIPTGDKLGGGMVSMGRPKASEGWDRPWMHDAEVTERKKGESAAKVAEAESIGRFPANLCHDGSDEVRAAFPDSKSTQAAASRPMQRQDNNVLGKGLGSIGPDNTYSDSGSAARFFYSAKASKADRALSKHPTVKPVKLMQWLVRLITPPGGVTLDPFAGTGTTGEAAWREGFSAVLIEREEEYQADIERRMLFARAKPKPEQTAAKRKKDCDPGTLELPFDALPADALSLAPSAASHATNDIAAE